MQQQQQLAHHVEQVQRVAGFAGYSNPTQRAIVEALTAIAGVVEQLDQHGSTRLRTYMAQRPAFALHDHELPEPDGLASSFHDRHQHGA